jgi:dTDP-glucose 4,6-dehydratase
MCDYLDNDLKYIYSKTDSILYNLHKKKILLTGGTGFIGKWLLEYFLWVNKNKLAEIEVFVISRNPESFLEKFSRFIASEINFIEGDILTFDFDSLGSCDHIIHAAADADAKLNYEDPLRMINTVVFGTRNVFDYGVRVKAQKILYLSSGAVYGVQPPELRSFPENYPGGPDFIDTSSAYAESKRLAELYAACYANQYGLNITIARCFAFVGPYLPLDKHFAIGNFILNGLRGEDIIIRGNGIPLRSYMYSADLVIWLLFCLINGKKGQAYNVGSDYAISILDLANEVSRFFPSVSVKVLGKISPTDRNQNYVPCTEKIKSELKVPGIVPLKEAIHRTVQFYLKNG